MAELKGKEREERLAWFEVWKFRKEQYLKVILKKIPQLDYSPNSLNDIEHFLLEKFEGSYDVFLLEHESLVNAICLYIGEVFKKNINPNIKWKVKLDNTNESVDQYKFICFLGNYEAFSGIDIFYYLPYVIKQRTGDTLLSRFQDSLRGYHRKTELLKKQKATSIPPSKGNQYQHFLFFKKGQLVLEDIEKILKEYFKKREQSVTIKKYNETRLVITFPDNYNFHFSLDNRDFVQVELKEIAADKGITEPDILACDARVEFWGDEDLSVDYFNESLFVLGELESLPIFMFDLTQGIFWEKQ